MSNLGERRRVRYAACLCFFPTLASAAVTGFVLGDYGSSPIPVSAGPRSLGLAGAFTAVADDATANSANPGGMIQLEDTEASASLGFYGRRTVAAGHQTSAEDSDLDHVGVVYPFFAFGFQQTVAAGWQRQFDFSRRIHRSFTDVDPDLGTTTTVDNSWSYHGAFSSSSLSYAIEPLPGLGLGLTVDAWGDDLTGNSSFHKHSHQVIDDSDLGITSSDVDSEVTVQRGFSAVLGAWWQLSSAWTLAATLSPEYDLHLRARSDGGPAADSTFHYPTSATVGSAYRWSDRQRVTTDLTWTQWSHYYSQSGDQRISPVNPFIAPRDFSAGYAARFGYERAVILPGWILVGRAGVSYEELPASSQAPAANQSSQVHATHDRFYGIASGCSLVLGKVIIDAGVQVRFGQDVGPGQDAAPDKSADVTTVTARAGVGYQF